VKALPGRHRRRLRDAARTTGDEVVSARSRGGGALIGRHGFEGSSA